MALTLEFRSSEQAWRSDVLEAKQLLQDRGLKTLCGCLSFLEGINFPSLLHAESHTLLESAYLEVIFQWQCPLRPCL